MRSCAVSSAKPQRTRSAASSACPGREAMQVTSSKAVDTETVALRRAAIAESLERNLGLLQRRIRFYLLRAGFTGPALAEEAGEVLARLAATALQKAEQFDPGRPALPWLKGIAFNLVRQRAKEKQIRRVVAPEDAAPELAGSLTSEE